MKIAFYAPLKPLDHPVPSGDRSIARGLAGFFESRGHRVMVQARVRTRWIYWRPWVWPLLVKEAFCCWIGAIKDRPDVWLTYQTYYKAPDLIGPLVCTFLKIPYVLFGASYATQRKKRFKTWPGFYLNRIALNRADQVFTNRKEDQAQLLRLLPPWKISSIVPGIGVEHSAFKRERQQGPRPVILTAAMFRDDVKTRGLAWLIRCCGLLAQKGVDFELVIAGGGKRQKDLEDLALIHLPGRHGFAGQLRPDQMNAFYDAGDLFAFPGINESLGMVFLEAQSRGLPVVAFDTGGIPEVVARGKTGFLVPCFDVQAFARALEQLILDPFLLQKMGRAARNHVLCHHDIHQTYLPLEAGLKRMIP
ncbi:MAG: glycosyltransferase family 4 protein [Proteobacteria bacterium]|nr:glycosyltransferase family 4 protein [Pseudomonadota bacterium]